jgi:chromosomal replication initiation ATPase DnaA
MNASEVLNNSILMPAIAHIVSTAEYQLKTISGFDIKVRLSIPNKEVNLMRLQEEVCKEFDVTWNEISGKSRPHHIVTARFIRIYFMRNELGMKLKDIGKLLGGRDHTTIIHAISSINRFIETRDSAVYPSIVRINNLLFSKNQ